MRSWSTQLGSLPCPVLRVLAASFVGFSDDGVLVNSVGESALPFSEGFSRLPFEFLGRLRISRFLCGGFTSFSCRDGDAATRDFPRLLALVFQIRA